MRHELGIRAIMFCTNAKDDVGSGAYDHNGIIQATRKAKRIA